MSFIYYIGILLYALGVRLAAITSPKARLWLKGRRGWKKQLDALKFDEACVWVHCSSLGEFEQGRPVIEAIKKANPKTPVLLSFFSPSGYEIRKDYPLADAVMYLPLDTPSNARYFVRSLKPKAVVFVKYDFWFFFLKALRTERVPHFLVSGIFRPSQYFFKAYGAWFVKGLKGFSKLFVQNEESRDLLSGIGLSSVVTGDTRFDRVVEVVSEAKPIPMIELFCEDAAFVGVMGSSWPQEEKMLSERLRVKTDENWIIVPHEVDQKHIEQIKAHFPEALCFSEARTADLAAARVLIIDQIGLLNRIYRYADLAVIGGGFGKGVHNTLEAAAYGVPVLFGPNYDRFQEIHDLIQKKAGFAFKEAQEFNLLVDQLRDDLDFRQKSGKDAKGYVQSKTGATAAVVAAIQAILPQA